MSARDLRVLVTVGFLIAYGLLLPVLGFFVSTALFLTVQMVFLGVYAPLWIAGTTVAMLAVSWAVFEMLLGVPLPHGWLY